MNFKADINFVPNNFLEQHQLASDQSARPCRLDLSIPRGSSLIRRHQAGRHAAIAGFICSPTADQATSLAPDDTPQPSVAAEHFACSTWHPCQAVLCQFV
jgi:hypothetical protein